MKTVAVLLLMVVAANAYSLNQLRRMIQDELKTDERHVTLREYLDDLDQPDEWARLVPESKRSFAKREDCAVVCGHPPTLSEGDTCASGKFAPEYVSKTGTNCECLTRYKCCDETCPTVNKEKCWDDNQKGFLYGVSEKDCCGCDIIKCLPCDAPQPEDATCPRGEGAKPADCYTYTKNYAHNSDAHQCFHSHCEAKTSDAPADEGCDVRCQRHETIVSHCLFDYKVCVAYKVFNNCPNHSKQDAISQLVKAMECYHEPQKVANEDGGHFYDALEEKCKKCTKWVYTEKSCDAKNAAAAAQDCHQYGANELDKKCFEKKTLTDTCGCKYAECHAASPNEPETFTPEEVCPKNHVKLEGTTLCMRERHVCKPCPPLIPINAADCPVGEVLKVKDCNGCDVNRCQLPQFDTCPQLCPEGAVAKYTYNAEDNRMTCECAVAV